MSKRAKDPSAGMVRGFPPEWFVEDIEIRTGPKRWELLDKGNYGTSAQIVAGLRRMIRFAVARSKRPSGRGGSK